ncbi:hypothetical protein CDCA_CDCA06G1885 [Cyanidium caldarium]|uniref:Uncharacterized protein n=1 Tax=Cyanidium caldarium TaxID=2771 RepID=A0AAV9IUU1_CYACA|nr:hypothetical protein CDCA_CDCA06G1885 [Cyanidium caldarium]
MHGACLPEFIQQIHNAESARRALEQMARWPYFITPDGSAISVWQVMERQADAASKAQVACVALDWLERGLDLARAVADKCAQLAHGCETRVNDLEHALTQAHAEQAALASRQEVWLSRMSINSEHTDTEERAGSNDSTQSREALAHKSEYIKQLIRHAHTPIQAPADDDGTELGIDDEYLTALMNSVDVAHHATERTQRCRSLGESSSPVEAILPPGGLLSEATPTASLANADNPKKEASASASIVTVGGTRLPITSADAPLAHAAPAHDTAVPFHDQLCALKRDLERERAQRRALAARLAEKQLEVDGIERQVLELQCLAEERGRADITANTVLQRAQAQAESLQAAVARLQHCWMEAEERAARTEQLAECNQQLSAQLVLMQTRAAERDEALQARAARLTALEQCLGEVRRRCEAQAAQLASTAADYEAELQERDAQLDESAQRDAALQTECARLQAALLAADAQRLTERDRWSSEQERVEAALMAERLALQEREQHWQQRLLVLERAYTQAAAERDATRQQVVQAEVVLAQLREQMERVQWGARARQAVLQQSVEETQTAQRRLQRQLHALRRSTHRWIKRLSVRIERDASPHAAHGAAPVHRRAQRSTMGMDTAERCLWQNERLGAHSLWALRAQVATSSVLLSLRCLQAHRQQRAATRPRRPLRQVTIPRLPASPHPPHGRPVPCVFPVSRPPPPPPPPAAARAARPRNHRPGEASTATYHYRLFPAAQILLLLLPLPALPRLL